MNILVTTLILFSISAFAQDGAEDFRWELAQTKKIDGKTYETYHNQDGDQIIIKPRTKKTQNPEEAPTTKNLPNRQGIFEFGLGFGFTQGSRGSLPFTKNGRTGEFGEVLDGSPTVYPKTWGSNFNIGFHPPTKYLKGFTTELDYMVHYSYQGNSNEKNLFDERGYKGSTGPHKAGLAHTINLISTQDFWYIPGAKSTSVFSAGAYYGYRKAQYEAGPQSIDSEYNPFRRDYGGAIKYRFLKGDGHKALNNLYVQVLVSKDKTFQVTFGFGSLFGPRNAPARRIEK